MSSPTLSPGISNGSTGRQRVYFVHLAVEVRSEGESGRERLLMCEESKSSATHARWRRRQWKRRWWAWVVMLLSRLRRCWANRRCGARAQVRRVAVPFTCYTRSGANQSCSTSRVAGTHSDGACRTRHNDRLRHCRIMPLRNHDLGRVRQILARTRVV